MARGWESKSVEDQVDARQASVIESDDTSAKLTDAERARQSEIRSLQLSRSRIVNQLATATNPRHRTMLERALAALDERLARTISSDLHLDGTV
ncbi:MAG: hypothetical protein MSG64_12525 [Pyrinomonadaceae bacterium MAG19_C2-C3]|nr:hypothetical protein [Pyrinomonadaceae bacterium MAG19_C2-C3]